MDQEPELHRDPGAAAEMAANAVLNYLRQSGITGRIEKQQWIAKVFDAVTAKELNH